MRFRKLRIAWSTVCVVACLLLVALWVRSYSICDVVYYRVAGRGEYQIDSLYGMIGFYTSDLRGKSLVFDSPMRYTTHEPVAKPGPTSWLYKPFSVAVFPKFFYNNNPAALGKTLDVPIWFVTALIAGCAGIPWVHWSFQFRVRALLLATTIAAIWIGLLVYALRK